MPTFPAFSATTSIYHGEIQWDWPALIINFDDQRTKGARSTGPRKAIAIPVTMPMLNQSEYNTLMTFLDSVNGPVATFTYNHPLHGTRTVRKSQGGFKVSTVIQGVVDNYYAIELVLEDA